MLTAAKWLMHSLPFVFLLLKVKCEVNVSITYVECAVSKGAVCLDGSPPAFHLSRGFGEGVNNWLIHLEGGGWCNNVTACLNRKSTRLGSSKYMAEVIPFSAILSNTKEENPDFYNWNRVKVRYCDGSSFTGDVEQVDPVTNLYYRGARVWLAVMEDLLTKGMSTAENALLSGCSAGGLASILHCDSFRALLPVGTKVKCLSDAGYFIDVKDIAGTDHIKSFFNDIVSLHGSAKNLPSSCTSNKLEPETCFFPQNAAKTIQTPLFILNAAYDHWQVRNSLVFGAPNGSWTKCKRDIQQCSSNQLEVIQNFRNEFLRALMQLGNSTSRGLFIDSCYLHCQTEKQGSWFALDSTVLGELRIAEAVGNWFYDRSYFQKIDCPYPCNPTCYNETKNATLLVYGS